MAGLGERAHHLVSDLCREAIATARPLLDLLAATPEVGRHLDRAALARLCDPAGYLGLAVALLETLVARGGLALITTHLTGLAAAAMEPVSYTHLTLPTSDLV